MNFYFCNQWSFLFFFNSDLIIPGLGKNMSKKNVRMKGGGSKPLRLNEFMYRYSAIKTQSAL